MPSTLVKKVKKYMPSTPVKKVKKRKSDSINTGESTQCEQTESDYVSLAKESE
jgi:hypothetical protein